ncbi:MAG: hypothetical protein ACKOOL_12725 [Novosphingobium sp.]
MFDRLLVILGPFGEGEGLGHGASALGVHGAASRLFWMFERVFGALTAAAAGHSLDEETTSLPEIVTTGVGKVPLAAGVAPA